MHASPPTVEDPVGPQPQRAATDPSAFDDLYRTEWSGLVALGWSLTGSWAASEELVQEAFTDALRRWDEVARLDKPGAWVRRAVINRAASLSRHRGVERRAVAVLGARRAADGDGPGDDRTGDDAAARVQDPAFWAALRSLPLRQRACIALHYLEDRPASEIAEVVGCSAATVKVHLHRGRRSLAEHLAHLSDRTATTEGGAR